jgi:predicted nucleic acid-binding protein
MLDTNTCIRLIKQRPERIHENTREFDRVPDLKVENWFD